ncbi:MULTISPECIES: hypothetical protein [Desulfococcus]|nr:hypothetical protein [Desulfococcus multivorans]AOY58532.1 uncharacterized protein Dmul_17590 [Desulfococcus multivorans]
MARNSEKRLEDWIRLILLNWVLISIMMFYSIFMGIGIGYLVIRFSRLVVDWTGLPAHLLDLFPTSGPTVNLMIGGLIAAVFLHLFRHLRYNCETESYTLKLSRVFNLRAAVAFAAIVMILMGMGAVFARLFPS